MGDQQSVQLLTEFEKFVYSTFNPSKLTGAQADSHL